MSQKSRLPPTGDLPDLTVDGAGTVVIAADPPATAPQEPVRAPEGPTRPSTPPRVSTPPPVPPAARIASFLGSTGVGTSASQPPPLPKTRPSSALESFLQSDDPCVEVVEALLVLSRGEMATLAAGTVPPPVLQALQRYATHRGTDK